MSASPAQPMIVHRRVAPARASVGARARRRVSASAAASVLLHVGALSLCTFVVYRTVMPGSGATEVRIDFESPGQGSAAPAGGPVGGPSAPGASAAGPSADAALDVYPVAATTLNAPLQGLSASLSALARLAGAPGGSAGSLAGASDAFDPALASDGGPQGVSFAGLGSSNARSVVYAVDCSGPMVTSLPLVMSEVERSVSRLAPTQKFGVILFRRDGDRPAMESFAPVLVRATPSARARLTQWLARAEPAGRSAPLAGLQAALALSPDAVFLLSRSIERSGGGVWELGLQATLDRLEQLNPPSGGGRRKAAIQTIQFIDEDPSGIMQAIGVRHGGAGGPGYRVIKRPEELSP